MSVRVKITQPGIYASTGKEIAVGTELTLTKEPKAWAGRYEVISSGGEGKDAVTGEGYAVNQKGVGWFFISKDGVPVTKSLRKDDLEGFADMSDEDKAAFVELHKAEA
ncbi:hypothetical protein BMJ34_20870 [Sinorhizobium medicae]|uniref:hypothetical protein n=1 Tax=Sinorhizobium medicae TaxID=110321 RepID=UPI000375E3AE|nr:hypothetical protein [Sinorhizobium medicae]MDX0623059.1 hypothetical protein [Sinorhizobium medicae]MDX0765609.1 hypothetical protein [Sinorhizobium medicae]MDX0827086.1 hypothetical protein [Sinorhizobium medicae]MDX1151194.1 hypothetical protein [Sinorhizobium medicae]PLT95491.1 hypothetical protein BMJ34_20870 [Sinorhizobium medicae]